MKTEQLMQWEIEDHARQAAGIHPQPEGVEVLLPPTVDSNGDPIIYTGEPGREIPPNGPVSQTQLYQWLGQAPVKGSLKDYEAAWQMIQKPPKNSHQYSMWKGAAWGQPRYYTLNGAGMSYQAWDQRFDGNNEISVNNFSVSAAVGEGSLYVDVSTGFGAQAVTQSAFSCNGYFYGTAGNYNMSFDYEAFITSKGSGVAQNPDQSFLGIGLWGYPNGYLGDISQRVAVIPFQDLVPTNVITAGKFSQTG